MAVPPGSTRELEEVSRAIDRFLASWAQYWCAEIDMEQSHYRIAQAISDRIYRKRLLPEIVILTGSKFEGMPLGVCSDHDMMYTQNTYPVVLQDLPPDYIHTHGPSFVTAQTNPHQPAYLRLAVPPGATFQNVNVMRSMVEDNDSQWLSSSSFVSRTLEDDTDIHGPAVTGRAVKKRPEYGNIDQVACFHSPCWPPCAQEFFSRPRPHGWPPASLLDDIRQAGCHVVGASHPSTERRDLEWRWSFSCAEKELVHKLPKTMICTIYILKATKKHSWSEDKPCDQPVGFCSYYLKMACLWIAELTEQSTDGNSISCARNVLDWIIQCYNKRNLPHYFIRDQNLICQLSKETCRKIANTLWEVKTQLWLKSLCVMKMDGNVRSLIMIFQGLLGITITPKPTSDDCRQLLGCLLDCDGDMAVRLMEGAAEFFGPGSKWYVRIEHHFVGEMSSPSYGYLYNSLNDNYNKTTAPRRLTIPERVLLPIVKDLSSIIKPDHVPCFRASLYRHLGDVYHNLYMHYRGGQKPATDIPAGLVEECYKKSEKYYTEGLHMAYPDGWYDKGLSGYVHLAKFFFLNGEWDKVGRVMLELQPLLEEVEHSEDTLIALSMIVIDKRHDMWTHTWRADRYLYQALLKPGPPLTLFINSAVLGWYIQARLALRHGRRGLAKRTVGCMEVAKVSTTQTEHGLSTQRLIEILRGYMCQYDAMHNCCVA